MRVPRPVISRQFRLSLASSRRMRSTPRRYFYSDCFLLLGLLVLVVWIAFLVVYAPSFVAWRDRQTLSTQLCSYWYNTHDFSSRVVAGKLGPPYDDSPYCDVWSPRSLFFTSPRSQISHENLPSLLPYSAAEHSHAVVASTWTHERTKLERSSKVGTTVFHCANPDVFLAGKQTNHKLKHGCNDTNDDFKRIDNDRFLNPSLILCRCIRTEDWDAIRRRAAVVEIPDGAWNDLLPTSNEGANLWHFHAALFRVWLSLRAIDAMVDHFHSKRDVDKATTLRTRDVILLLPDRALRKMKFPDTLNTLHVTDDTLLELHHVHRALMSSVEGLQGIADALGNRLFLSRKGITRVSLMNSLRKARFSTLIDAWVIPPHDGFLWDIAHDDTLSGKVVKCRNSLLQQYGNDLLYFSSRMPMSRNIGTKPDLNSSIVRRQQTIAKHVCIVSRQSRDRPGSTEPRGNLRNLTPDTLLRILSRLSAPILLTPSLGLRGSDDVGDGNLGPMMHLFTGNMTQATVSEQMWYLHQECALILGVHGAGLTNAIGLRRGTAIVELMPKGKHFQYFRNIAALLDDTTYDVTFIGNGTERDLSMSEEEVRQLVSLVNDRTADSIRKQIMYCQDQDC